MSLEKFTDTGADLVDPCKHVVDVALWVMCVDLNGSGHAPGAASAECSDEALEEGIVTGCSDLQQDQIQRLQVLQVKTP